MVKHSSINRINHSDARSDVRELLESLATQGEGMGNVGGTRKLGKPSKFGRPRSNCVDDAYGFGPENVGLIFPMIASHFS